MNSKGLETYGGFRKDAYYLFQSFLRPETPVVHLCGKTWFLRRSGSQFEPPGVKAYSNVPALTLTVNGVRKGTARNGEYTLADGTRADNVFGWDAPLAPGRNTVTVDDGAGHTDSTVIYAEGGMESKTSLVRNLTSGNPANPATFIDQPIQAEWPLYDDFDGTADNTFHAIPDALNGACEITLDRPSKAGKQTTLGFQIAPDAGIVDVFFLVTAAPAPPPNLPASFTDTGLHGTWRDNALNLVPVTLYRRVLRGGDQVTIPAAALDYLVLVKRHAAG